MDERRVRVSKLILLCAIAFSVFVTVPCIGKESRGPTPPRTVIAWSVTIDATNKAKRIAYRTIPSATNCPAPTGSPTPLPDRGDLMLCRGDTVQWQAQSDNNNHLLVITIEDGTILDGGSFYSASNGDHTSPTKVLSSAASGTYKYSVVLYDKNQNPTHVYQDDPVIIIGGNR